MKQFCEEVLKFLRSEYSDAYKFEIEHRVSILSNVAELTINVGYGYKVKVSKELMSSLFELYCDGEFIEERKQYRWQKELIDIIEGS